MERFYLEEANIDRKEQAIDYIKEHIKFNSEPSGTSGLDNEYENYENWLKKLEQIKNIETCPSDRCIGRKYFLIRTTNKLSEWSILDGI